MIRACAVCGKEFDARTCGICCNVGCYRIRLNEQKRRLWAEHLEERRAYDRRHYAAHSEMGREQSRKAGLKYRAGHREVLNAKRHRYISTERGKIVNVANSHNRRTRLSGISMTADTVLDLRAEFLGYCPYCWDKIEKGHVDHIMPVSKGGTNERNNLVWVCQECNHQKGDKNLAEFRVYQEQLAGVNA